ncbi:flagellar assembly protein A [Alkalicoccus urumqiensis]|uniref:RNA-binding protein KhpB N-terminal domain-containing protein n=1 Tax=Alkalicoccus urumqiensis TaxID=1548213 RepID=A0A2P6MIQ7_ALKUR|nr:FapA family protein [Alkalicoccus urumqiensis]PRO66169.1 hypothetical protein C6I21_05035 [Alkalicoccus urumqiensis]
MAQDTFTGMTVEEAVDTAAKHYQVPADQLDIRVLESGGSGFFGIRKKSQAKISVRMKASASIPEWEGLLDVYTSADQRKDHGSLAGSTKGKVWIRENQIYFDDSGPRKPIVHVPREVEFRKNGEAADGRVFLSSGDTVEMTVDVPPRETSWSVEVDKKKQEVRLTVRPGAFFTAEIKEKRPAEQIRIEYDVTETPFNQLNRQDIMDQLGRMKICHGIEEKAIQTACRADKEAVFVIASGKLPKHGKDGRLDFTIDIKERNKIYKEREDGTIDYRESIEIPNVEEGLVFAKVIEPTEGEDGISVFGEVLKSRPGKPIQLIAGDGVALEEESRELIAAASGRPKFEHRGQTIRLSILPKLVHRGNLTLEEGNIRFIGDVEIVGSVESKMVVEAFGDAWVHQNVDGGFVHSRGSTTINGNALNARVAAGRSSALYDDVQHLLRRFLEAFLPFRKAFEQIIQSDAFRSSYTLESGWGPLVKRLLEKRFSALHREAQTFTAYVEENSGLLDRRWTDYSTDIKKGLLVFHQRKSLPEDFFLQLEEGGRELHDLLQTPVLSTSRLALRYAAQSVLYSDGEIDILGKGVMHSHLYADGAVTIQQRMIGGRVHAGKEITVGEAGSPGGAKTQLTVKDPSGTISCSVCHPDVVFTIDDRRYIVQQEMHQVKVFLNDKGLLEVTEK